MFSNVLDAINFIEGCKKRKYNIDQVKLLLAKHGNFHNILKFVHIGGTNGKGSTTNFLTNCLIESGYKVGSFTSPYLIVHNDRIRINNEYISDQDLLDIINRFYDDFQTYQLSFFEMDTFIALYYFYINKVDIAIIEVGLGGRLDATNVITPLISVVVNIGMDHMEYLGNTLESIAFEKAGIIKMGVPFYTMEDKPECLSVFKKTCTDKKAQFNQVLPPRKIEMHEEDITFFVGKNKYKIKGTASYQPYNATLAIKVALKLKVLGWDKINQNSIKQGIAKSFWLGRFEKISSSPLVYIDGAHNHPGINVLCETLNNYKKQGYKIKIIFTALKDKEYKVMLEELLKVTDDITITQFNFIGRDTDISTLMGNLKLKSNPSWQDLYHEVMKIKDDKILTIFAGSLYFISYVRAYHLKGGN